MLGVDKPLDGFWKKQELNYSRKEKPLSIQNMPILLLLKRAQPLRISIVYQKNETSR